MTNATFRQPPPNFRKHNAHDDNSRVNQGKEKPQRYNNALKVFVKNIPSGDQSLHSSIVELFKPCGKLLDDHFYEKILAGQKICQGLLVYSSEEEAERATQLTGTLFEGRHLIVSRFRQYAQPTSRTVIVSNVAIETDEEDLWQFFENCGSIKYIHIERPLKATSLRAEVHFKSDKGAGKALKLCGNEIKGNNVSVTGQLQKEQSKEFPIFVTGLSHDIQKEDLLTFFDGCGPIKRIKITCKQGEDGYAEIFFMDSESAENALARDGNDIAGHVLSITQREESMLHEQYRNPLFLAGLPRDTKDFDIFLKFQDCGLIHNIKFVQSKHGLLKKAFIEFQEPEGVAKAFAMENLEIKNKKIVIGRTREVWTSFNCTPTSLSNGKKRKSKLENDTSFEAPDVKPSAEGSKKTKRAKKESNEHVLSEHTSSKEKKKQENKISSSAVFSEEPNQEVPKETKRRKKTKIGSGES